MPHPNKGESASYPVYSMGRVICPCCGRRVWRIEYEKGEVRYESDTGEVHRVTVPSPPPQVTQEEVSAPESLF